MSRHIPILILAVGLVLTGTLFGYYYRACGSLRLEVSDLKQKIGALEKENEAYRKKIAEMTKRKSGEEEDDEKNALRRERGELKQELEDLYKRATALEEIIKEREEELKKKEKMLDDLREELRNMARERDLKRPKPGERVPTPEMQAYIEDLLKRYDFNTLERLGEVAVPAFMDLLNEGIPSYRQRAAFTLGEIRDGVAVGALAELLNDREDFVAVEAARALGKIGDPRAEDSLIGVLGRDPDKYWEVQREAIIALRKLNSVNAVPALMQMAGSGRVDLQAEANTSLHSESRITMSRIPTSMPSPRTGPSGGRRTRTASNMSDKKGRKTGRTETPSRRKTTRRSMNGKPTEDRNKHLKDAIRIKTGEVRYWNLDQLSGGSIKDQSKEINMRAPKRPFPWWGPFDAADAVGRTMLLLCLCALAGLFAASVVFIMQFRPDGWFWEVEVVGYGAIFAIIVACGGFFGAMGAGILLGKNWGSVLFKTILVLATLTQFVLTVMMSLALAIMPSGNVAYLKLLSPVSLAASALLYFGTVYPLWRYWGECHVRYNFGFVSQEELTDGLYNSTRRFARAMIFLGIVFAAAALMIDIGIWEEGFGRGFSSSHRTALEFMHVLKYLITVAVLVAIPLYSRKNGYRNYRTIAGIIILAVLHWSVMIYFMAVSPVNETELTLAGIPLVAGYLLGFVLLAAGTGFYNRSDAARKMLAWIPLIFFLVALAYTILVFVEPWTGLWRELEYFDEDEMVIFLAFMFAIVIPVYVLFELHRYFHSDKAKAWCRSGKYLPPWQAQLRLISEYAEEEEILIVNPEKPAAPPSDNGDAEIS
ncbi:MAG: HEAT repeat domain-containing protein [Planctomycetota bacterium]|jgi:hypothetical protein